MADLGLLGAIGTGLKEGMSSYQDAREKAFSEAMKKRAYNADLVSKGLVEGENGAVALNPAKQAEQDLSLTKNTQALQEYDPNSERSGMLRQRQKGLISQVNPDLASAVPDNMSGADVTAKNPLMDEVVKGEYGNKKASLMAELAGQRLGLMGQRLNLAQDNQTAQAAKAVENNQMLVKMKSGLNQLARGRAILDKPVITNQEFNDYQQEIQSAITNSSSGGSLGKLERTEYTSLQGKLAGLKQYVTGNPTDAVPREVVERLKALADHTRDVMKTQMVERAKSLPIDYAHNPRANEAQKKAAGAFIDSGDTPANGLMNQKPGAGAIIESKGVKYRVGLDGETLEPVK